MNDNKEQINQLKEIKRNGQGLIEGLEYKYTPEGLVDWKSMIPAQFLYVNNDPKRRDKLEKKYGKPYSEIDPVKDNVQDQDLVIMLGGIRFLAKTRGFNYVKYNIKESREEYASVNCEIEFIPNYETENKSVIYSDNACAHFRNTSNFAQQYLLEICTNRAFCRTIRGFLCLAIVSKEELGAETEEDNTQNTSIPETYLKNFDKFMESKHVTWDHLVIKLKKDGHWDEKYKSFRDLPKNLFLIYYERLKNWKEKV